MQLEEMPLTATGEIERHLLGKPQDSGAQLERVAARNELERQIADIWQQVFNVPQVGIYDNFFELGGHSLLAIRLFAEIEQKFAKKFPLAILFQAGTVEGLAKVLIEEESATSDRILTSKAEVDFPLSKVEGIHQTRTKQRCLTRNVSDPKSDRRIQGAPRRSTQN